MVGGRKVVGSAQLRQGDALLQHGSILLGDDQSAVATVTRGPAPAAHAAPLNSIVGTPVDEEHLIAAVSTAARARWRGEWREYDHPDEIVAASGRHAPRFRSAEWTWGA